MIGLMVKKEFRQLKRDKRMLPMVLLAPVVQLLLLGYAAVLEPKDVPVVVCDLDRTVRSRELTAEFFSSGFFLNAGYIDGSESIEEGMERAGGSAALVIPDGFGRNLEAGRTPEIAYFADGSDSTTAVVATGYAERIISRYASEYGTAGGSGTAAAASGAGSVGSGGTSGITASGFSIPSIDIRTRIFFNPALKSRDFMVPGLLALVLMVMTMMLTSLAVVKEKEIGTMEQLIVTPLGTRDILLGKLLPFIAIGVLDILLIIGASRVIFGLDIAGSFFLLFAFSLVFLFSSLGLGLLISTFSENQQQAMMASVFFVMMPMIILSGFVFPVENMPAPIRALTYALPLRYYFTIVRGIYLKGAGVAELWDEGAALLILGIIIFSISLLRFRKRLE